MNFAWLADLWNQSPRGLKKAMALGLVAFAITVGVVIGVHIWTAGWIQERMGAVATKTDIQEQTDSIVAGNTIIADQVTDALQAYDDSLKAFLQHERRLAVDTTLKPLIKMVFGLQGDMQELKGQQRTTQSRVSELPAAYEGTLRQIIEEKPPSRVEALLEEVLNRQRASELLLDSLTRAKTRTTRVRM